MRQETLGVLVRDVAILNEQVTLIRAGLRSVVTPDLVEGKDTDHALVLPGRGETLGIQRRPRTEADFAAAVRHLVDELHPAVRWRLPSLLSGLTYQERTLLRLRVGWNHSAASVRRALGLSKRYAVDLEVQRLLQRLARDLWDDEYQVRHFAPRLAAREALASGTTRS